MSSGVFTIANYEADYGAGTAVHKIRVQPETLLATIGAAVNNSVATAVNNPISAMVSASKRGLGLHARTVTLKLDPAALLPGYSANSVVRLPCVNKAFFAACQAAGTTQVTYLAVLWNVSGTSAEVVK